MAYGRCMQVKDSVRHGPRRRRGNVKQYFKKAKARAERRRAKQQPDCQPHYRRFYGWES